LIQFLLNRELRTEHALDPNVTVLQYLREHVGKPGTKEGCASGDCGACTVVVGELDGERVRYRTLNSCLTFVSSLHGKQLISVEDLKHQGQLHSVQQAMVDCHGSQCGFCTPGFVMSLFAMTRDHAELPGEAAIDDTLAGNLCRCTGYAPIVRAAQQAYDHAPRDDRFARGETDTLAKLTALQDGKALEVSDGGNAAPRRFFAPANLDDLAGLYQQYPDATLTAGATDVGLWVTKDLKRPQTVIYTGRVAELARLEEKEDHLEIGAGVTYSDALALLGRHYPDMGEVIRRIGSVQERNTGTLGGNVANGSPIGDSPPLLIAAGATLHLRQGQRSRSLPLEDFFLAYGRQDRAAGELVARIDLPLPAANSHFRAYKVSKRFDQDITAVLGAFNLTLEGGVVTVVRLAYGGLAATPKRAAAAEAALSGQPWTEATVERAMAALAEDFQPLTDWRASREYRLKVAQNLLRRCWIETTEPQTATRLVGQDAAALIERLSGATA
jgi:xanthine dehydrogenase small subunit